MPWSGGSFSLAYDFVADSNAGPPLSRISSSRVMAQLQDIADGLEECLKANGDVAWTDDMDADGHKLTDLGAATLKTDAPQAQQVPSLNYAGTLGGSATAMTATQTLGPTSISAGFRFRAVVNATNTSTTPTLNYNSTGAATIIRHDTGPLAIGDLVKGVEEEFLWDGTNWRRVTETVRDAITVISTATAPPVSPANGDAYLIVATASGAYLGLEGYVGRYVAGAWTYRAPTEGMVIWDATRNCVLVYDGSSWVIQTATQAVFKSLASANVTLTELESAAPVLVVYGALSANRTVTSTRQSGTLLVVNMCTGDYPVTLSNGGTTADAPKGGEAAFTLSSGAVAATATKPDFPPGTIMLFAQTAAPTGWTKLTDIDNAALRIVSGSASTGGTANFTDVFKARTIARANLPNVTLATDIQGAHAHNVTNVFTNDTGSIVSAGGGSIGSFVSNKATTSSGAHAHTTDSLNGNVTQTDMDFAVKYVDVIRAQKT